MGLLAVPTAVLDNILRWLNRPQHRARAAYVSLSSTCKALHEPANRYLYRYPGADANKKEMYHSLIRSPSNSKFVRIIAETQPGEVEPFHELWAKVPLKLRFLDLSFYLDYYQVPYSFYEYTVLHFLASRHPETTVEYVRWPFESVSWVETDLVLRDCYKLRGLRSLEIRLDPGSYDDGTYEPVASPQDVVNHLNCPHLESLYIVNGREYTVTLGDKLPSLRRFHRRVNRNRLDGVVYDPPSYVLCEFLMAMMDRRIYFAVQSTYKYDPTVPFYMDILDYASQEDIDPKPLIQWLFLSDLDLQHQSRQLNESLNLQVDNKRPPFYFNFVDERFTSVHLETTLRVLLPLFPREKTWFSVNIYDYPFSAVETLLPTNVISLALYCHGSIHPSLLPIFITALPYLRHVNIKSYTGEASGRCTIAPTPGSVEEYCGRKQVSHTPLVKLGVMRGKIPTWWADKVEKDFGDDVVEFEREITSLFDLGQNLEEIRIHFQYRKSAVGNKSARLKSLKKSIR